MPFVFGPTIISGDPFDLLSSSSSEYKLVDSVSEISLYVSDLHSNSAISSIIPISFSASNLLLFLKNNELLFKNSHFIKFKNCKSLIS